MRGLAGTLCGLSLFAAAAAEATLIERSVEIDLLQLDLPGRRFEATLDFDNATLNLGDRLVLDIRFVNGQVGVHRGANPQFDFPAFLLELHGNCDQYCGNGRVTPTLVGTNGDLHSDTLVRFGSPVDFFALGEPDRSEGASFAYSGLRYEHEFHLTSGTVSSLRFAQSFFAPHGPGDSLIYRVPESVPEPATLSLLGVGVLSLIFTRRRHRSPG